MPTTDARFGDPSENPYARARRDVLSHIRPQGHPEWEVNTCLVTNDQLKAWWAILGETPTWETGAEIR